MGIQEMSNMYKKQYSYTCEKCGTKVPFLDEYCGNCGTLVPEQYRLHITLYSYNLNKPLWEKAKKLPVKLQNQIAEKLAGCESQAEINKKAQHYLEIIDKKMKK